ncbi:relaxase/mobilization nuclease domain-containing protein [Naasia lichenicola]|nr:relaxase/mobilization nuclease domain-containing protein [Naasia lichenicola]
MALAVAEELDAPRKAFGTEVTRVVTVADPDGGEPIRDRVPASVWHASLSLRAEEGQLDDEKWAAIADDFIDAMGFSDIAGEAPCRWVAIRHGLSSNGNDHIHIAVSLVREDGTKASTHNDFRKAQTAARDLEKKYGLQVLESRENGLGERGVKPGERSRAEREDKAEVDAHRLERTVRGAAAASLDEGEFVRRLNQHGVLVRPRFAAGRDDVVAGYSVAMRPEKGGRPIWYGGGRLARDLTLPRLREGWADSVESVSGGVAEWQASFRNPWRYRPARPGRETEEVSPRLVREFAADIARLRSQLREVPVVDRSAWAHAARDAAGVFAAWSARVESTPGPLAATARALARSAHLPAHESKPRPMHLQSLAGAASLLALADPKMTNSAAAAILLRQMGRTVVAIMEAHRAAGEAERARQLSATMRDQIIALRDDQRAAAARHGISGPHFDAISDGWREVRSGNPIRPSNGDRPRSFVPPTARDRSADHGR